MIWGYHYLWKHSNRVVLFAGIPQEFFVLERNWCGTGVVFALRHVRHLQRMFHTVHRYWTWPVQDSRMIWCLMIFEQVDNQIFWSNYSDLTRPHPKWWFSKGIPLISGKSRLVKYYNLARNIDRYCCKVSIVATAMMSVIGGCWLWYLWFSFSHLASRQQTTCWCDSNSWTWGWTVKDSSSGKLGDEVIIMAISPRPPPPK